MKRYLLALAIAALPPALQAQGPASCRASLTPVELRAGSTAELLGDIVLQCSGGSTGRVDILVLSDAPYANRDLSPDIEPTWGLTDSLLLIGDPAPAAQSPCVLAGPSAICPADKGFNVFQGRRLQDNLIAFQGIPYNPATPRLRIVNLRASALSAAPALQVLAYANGRGLTVENANLATGTLQTPPQVSVTLPNGAAPPASGVTLLPSQLPAFEPNATRGFQIRVAETAANTFRKRNTASSAADPSFTVAQATPGVAANTESGFFNPAFPAQYGLNQVGLAHSGTRVLIEFRDFPANVAFWAAPRDASGKAVLTAVDANGAGLFAPPATRIFSGFSEVRVENGSATLAYEVTSADPVRLETLVFSFAVSAYVDSSPQLGAATVLVRLGPTAAAATHPSFVSDAKPIPAFRIATSIESPPISIVSAASLASSAVSPDSLVTILGTDLAESTATAAAPQGTLAGLTVSVLDSIGTEAPASLYYASPTQANLVLPANLAPGPALIRVVRAGTTVASGTTVIDTVAPGLFSANGDPAGLASGMLLRIADTAAEPAPLARFIDGAWTPAPISFGDTPGLVYLSLYATGLRHRSSLEQVTATLGDTPVPVLLAGPNPSTPGIDQINLGPLPASTFTGRGSLPLTITVDGKPSNTLRIHFE